MTNQPKPRTDTETFHAIRALGLSVQKRDGEWKVDYKKGDPRHKPGDEGSAYFTNDREDAIWTALAMDRPSHKLSVQVPLTTKATRIEIQVFSSGLFVKVNDGMLHSCFDWVMVFDFIRPEDKVVVRNYTGNEFWKEAK